MTVVWFSDSTDTRGKKDRDRERETWFDLVTHQVQPVHSYETKL